MKNCVVCERNKSNWRTADTQGCNIKTYGSGKSGFKLWESVKINLGQSADKTMARLVAKYAVQYSR